MFTTNYTSKQWLVLAISNLAYISTCMCFSVPPPIFPSQAERKGLRASQYGFVFSIYDFTMLLTCFSCAKYVGRSSLKMVFCAGLSLNAVGTISFGFLDFIPEGITFLSLSLVHRVVQAFGHGAFQIAMNVVVAITFPNSLGLMFSILESSYGISLALGPSMAGALYELGGYRLPYWVVGGFSALLTVCGYLVIPNYSETTSDTEEIELKSADSPANVSNKKQPTANMPPMAGGLYRLSGYGLPYWVVGGSTTVLAVCNFLVVPGYGTPVNDGIVPNPESTDAEIEECKPKMMKPILPHGTTYAGHTSNKENIPTLTLTKAMQMPDILLAALVVVIDYIGIGFIHVSLEPHLRQLELSKFQVGLIFMIDGSIHALLSPLWGWICDKHKKPWPLVLVGLVAEAIFFCCIGPFPGVWWETTVPWVIISLIVHGFGMSCIYVPAFMCMVFGATEEGYTDHLQVSVIASSLTLGAYVGGYLLSHSFVGALLDAVGFQWATLLPFTLFGLIFVMILIREMTKLFK